MLLPGREWQEGYRFGFNGKEQDPEQLGQGNIYDYGFRIYNPRLGKFLSVDPLTRSYPWYTPYQFAANKPILCIDLDGLEDYVSNNYYDDLGNLIRQVITMIGVENEMGEYVPNNLHMRNGSQDFSSYTTLNINHSSTGVITFSAVNSLPANYDAIINSDIGASRITRFDPGSNQHIDLSMHGFVQTKEYYGPNIASILYDVTIEKKPIYAVKQEFENSLTLVCEEEEIGISIEHFEDEDGVRSGLCGLAALSMWAGIINSSTQGAYQVTGYSAETTEKVVNYLEHNGVDRARFRNDLPVSVDSVPKAIGINTGRVIETKGEIIGYEDPKITIKKYD